MKNNHNITIMYQLLFNAIAPIKVVDKSFIISTYILGFV